MIEGGGNDFMDIGGFVPIFGGKYFLERATGKIFEVDRENNTIREVEAPDNLDDWPEDDPTP